MMRKTYEPSHNFVDRLEKKYQKKIRFQKYKNFTRQFRQHLSRVQGIPVGALDEEEMLDMFRIQDYEYIGR